jgi:pilus assembly protein TadC
MKFSEITKNIYSNYSLNNISNRMKLLGKDLESDTLKFLNIRLLSSIVIFFVILYLVDWGYILSPIIVVLYYIYLPNLTIDQKIKKRKAKLEDEAIYFFEILALSLESGNNLYTAIS